MNINRHLDDGRLRAYLDGELSSGEQRQTSDRQVADHLAVCERCRARLAEIERTAQRVALAMDHLDPTAAPRPELALAHARATLDSRQPGMYSLWRSLMNRKATRAIATSVVAVALLIGVFSFAPTRALAREFLSIFRVRRFAVVHVDPNDDDMEYVVNALNDTLTATEPEVYVDEPVTVVKDIAEASAVAGFDVRMPTNWMDVDRTISVKGRSEVGYQVTPESLNLLFELAGMDPDLAPEDLGDGMLHGIIPAMVSIESYNTVLVQMLDPVLEYPEGVDPALIGEAGLRIMGMSEKEAKRISQSIDWGTTMLMPIPSQYVSVQETVIGGHEAVLLIPAEGTDDRQTLLWEADDVVYVLSHRGAYAAMVDMAVTMYE